MANEPNWVRSLTFRQRFSMRTRILHAFASGVGGDRSLKDFGIFIQAIPLEARLRDFAAIFVSRRRVQSAEPAVVFPGRRADKNAFSGKLRRLHFRSLAVEGHSRMILCQPGIKDESSQFRRDQRSLRQATAPFYPRSSPSCTRARHG